MIVYRIHISSWTASFRYPNFISGYQPTLTAPPVSTINGLISSAAGRYFVVSQERIGYVLTYKAKTVDLETIYQMGQGLTGIKSNVIKREFLSDVELYLYTDCERIAGFFRRPVYQMLLGRSGDLAQVNEIREIDIEEKDSLKKVKGTVIPFNRHQGLAAPIQAIPRYFSNTIPRRNMGTQPYFILDGGNLQLRNSKNWEVQAAGFRDNTHNDLDWDVYWQES